MMTLAEHVFAAFDDFNVLGRTLGDADAMTLFTHLRDEMYFLPAFLDHYRRLGIERFIVVDDRSQDGSREFLLDQPDVMVLGTSLRFGETRSIPSGHLNVKAERAKNAWHNLLPARYAPQRWSAKVDLDEFVELPLGMTFRDLDKRAKAAGGSAVYGAMLDLYPERLALGEAERTFDPDNGWYFDALPHLRLRGSTRPRQVYNGARARLLVKHGLWPAPVVRASRRLLGVTRPPMFCWLFKAVFIRWGEETLQENSHVVRAPTVPDAVLPIKHYKFADDVRRRTGEARKQRDYALRSREYSALDGLVDLLERTGSRLTFEHSRPVEGFEAFAASGNGRIGT